jgi:hypothetical protein
MNPVTDDEKIIFLSYLINLKRRPDRILKFFRNNKNEILPLNIFEAVDGKKLEKDHKEVSEKINELILCKNRALNQILILKSAYSIIDQMFDQEIINAETKRRNWYKNTLLWLFCKNSNKIYDFNNHSSFKNNFDIINDKPRKLNKFITLMNDPLNDEIYENKIINNTRDIEDVIYENHITYNIYKYTIETNFRRLLQG